MENGNDKEFAAELAGVIRQSPSVAKTPHDKSWKQLSNARRDHRLAKRLSVYNRCGITGIVDRDLLNIDDENRQPKVKSTWLDSVQIFAQ